MAGPLAAEVQTTCRNAPQDFVAGCVDIYGEDLQDGGRLLHACNPPAAASGALLAASARRPLEGVGALAGSGRHVANEPMPSRWQLADAVQSCTEAMPDRMVGGAAGVSTRTPVVSVVGGKPQEVPTLWNFGRWAGRADA